MIDRHGGGGCSQVASTSPAATAFVSCGTAFKWSFQHAGNLLLLARTQGACMFTAFPLLKALPLGPLPPVLLPRYCPNLPCANPKSPLLLLHAHLSAPAPGVLVPVTGHIHLISRIYNHKVLTEMSPDCQGPFSPAGQVTRSPEDIVTVCCQKPHLEERDILRNRIAYPTGTYEIGQVGCCFFY